ncbi:hypothetical protein Ahy_A04g018725 [Arachis hypogaea]|uniref:Beta-amylase n=1 Tax=Arachis hypogaea TaxID=3818 RepID=A0A445DEE1_ARAHY|nr:hypothetical protein Ahy_A04g018725 [Arachis hypogaea]
MEISVIGSSQDNLGMPELGNRELDFINLKDGFRISNDRVCFRKNIKWKKDGIRFTLRALQSEPVQAEKHSGVGRRSKSISFFCFDLHAGFCFWLDGVRLFVGLPLDAVSKDCNSLNHARAITAGLKALKLLGVEGVEFPVWWEIIEKDAAGKYD